MRYAKHFTEWTEGKTHGRKSEARRGNGKEEKEMERGKIRSPQ